MPGVFKEGKDSGENIGGKDLLIRFHKRKGFVMARSTSQKKQRGNFNLFDVFVILLIIGAIAGVWYLFFRDSGAVVAQETKLIEYQMEFTDQYSDLKNAPKAGDLVTDADKSNQIGTIYDVKTTEYKKEIHVAASGDLALSRIPGKYNIILTIRAQATVDKGAFYVDGRIIRNGEEISIKSTHFVGSGECVGVKEITEQAQNTAANAGDVMPVEGEVPADA